MTNSQPGDTERILWEGIPKDLESKVVSLDELKASFPNYEINVIRTDKDFWDEHDIIIYGDMKNKNSLAYKCYECKKIVIGPPKIIDHNTIHLSGGSKSIHIYCTNCKKEINFYLLAMKNGDE